jgi:propionyl-CoA carboxylase alpha chain
MVDGTPLVMKVGQDPDGVPDAAARGGPEGAMCAARASTNWPADAGKAAPPDTSKYLLCPMPGLVVKINVAEGDEVQEGQALATVEAMKMENILKAERKGVVKKIKASAGASLKVDDVIMEFE